MEIRSQERLASSVELLRGRKRSFFFARGTRWGTDGFGDGPIRMVKFVVFVVHEAYGGRGKSYKLEEKVLCGNGEKTWPGLPAK